MTITNSAERLTWDEITERYPKTWVGLTDLKFKKENGATLESAVVKATGLRDELYETDGVNYVMYTDLSEFDFCIWSVMEVYDCEI